MLNSRSYSRSNSYSNSSANSNANANVNANITNEVNNYVPIERTNDISLFMTINKYDRNFQSIFSRIPFIVSKEIVRNRIFTYNDGCEDRKYKERIYLVIFIKVLKIQQINSDDFIIEYQELKDKEYGISNFGRDFNPDNEELDYTELLRKIELDIKLINSIKLSKKEV